MRRPRLSATLLIATVALSFAAVGCGGADASGEGSEEITVFAASSLSEAFTDIGKAFETANPATTVRLNFAASSALATQINEGAPADVFASADLAQMRKVTDEGNARRAKVFATNEPVVVVARESQAVTRFADLANPGLRLVLGAPDVPIGRYAREILERAPSLDGVTGTTFAGRALANLKSNEPSVRGVLTKVQLGEADAGIVYRTDLSGVDDVAAVEIPAQFNVVAEYPIAAITGSKRVRRATDFQEFVLSPEGQAILRNHGFGPP